MKYYRIKGHDLSPDLVARWAEIQETSRDLASPYFRPEFTQAVASVRNDVYIGLIENGGRIVGFFPHHRSWHRVARPVGLGLSDYHGVIAEADAEWTVEDLLRGCGVVRYDFNHLPASQSPFTPHCRSVGESSIIEVHADFKTYEAARRELGNKQLKDAQRRRRQLEREHGPLRFDLNSNSPTAFQQMIDWKRQQCQQTGVVDYFAKRWTVDLVGRIHQHDSTSFGGNLAVLYLGDTLIAAHFFMRSSRVWHAWFPRYHEDFRRYSPGLILLIEMIRAACELPVEHIDIGKDISAWKERFRTGTIPIAEGCVEVPALLNRIRRLRRRAEDWSRSSALRPILRIPGGLIKLIERKRRYG